MADDGWGRAERRRTPSRTPSRDAGAGRVQDGRPRALPGDGGPPLAAVAGGKGLFQARLAASSLLAVASPSRLGEIHRQVSGNRRAARRAISHPSAYRQKTSYSLPFSGEWYVYIGGPLEATAHSRHLVSQRYAYDFVIADGRLRRWRDGSRGDRPADYLCYDEPVLAPADGVVAETRDGVPDAPRPGTGWVDPFASDVRGNFVVVRHADGEFSLLAHLASGSVRVGEGELVRRGQQVGRCGNSGNSTEPHLHFQVQDHPDFFEAAGLPVAFDGVSVNGRKPADERYLERDARVRQAEPRSVGPPRSSPG